MEGKDKLGSTYVCSLNGWYDHKSDIGQPLDESTYQLLCLYPGAEVTMCVGAINSHTFTAVDDELVCEYTDPDPLTVGALASRPIAPSFSCMVLRS